MASSEKHLFFIKANNPFRVKQLNSFPFKLEQHHIVLVYLISSCLFKRRFFLSVSLFFYWVCVSLVVVNMHPQKQYRTRRRRRLMCCKRYSQMNGHKRMHSLHSINEALTTKTTTTTTTTLKSQKGFISFEKMRSIGVDVNRSHLPQKYTKKNIRKRCITSKNTSRSAQSSFFLFFLYIYSKFSTDTHTKIGIINKKRNIGKQVIN